MSMVPERRAARIHLSPPLRGAPPPRVRGRPARRASGAAGGEAIRRAGCALALAALLAGCLTTRPFAPYPDTVTVRHPAQVDGRLSYEELREEYTTSPRRNPDGLGVFEAIEPRSRMTLWLWEIQEKQEEANRIAYARTAEEQAKVLAGLREFHAGHVVFEGVLLSNGKEIADARWYLPEGIYLVDDAGRKFKPLAVAEGFFMKEWLILWWPQLNPNNSSSADIFRWVTGYPRIVFPGEAIGPRTRAVTLYFAAAMLRFSFTWIFDPTYVPERQNLGPPHGAGMNRLFGQP
jgi:hypothetical protein